MWHGSRIISKINFTWLSYWNHSYISRFLKFSSDSLPNCGLKCQVKSVKSKYKVLLVILVKSTTTICCITSMYSWIYCMTANYYRRESVTPHIRSHLTETEFVSGTSKRKSMVRWALLDICLLFMRLAMSFLSIAQSKSRSWTWTYRMFHIDPNRCIAWCKQVHSLLKSRVPEWSSR